MDVVLVIVWILAMVLYSFSSDYALDFPNHTHKELPFVRWGSLIVAMGLSAYLAQAYREYLQDTGIWMFVIGVFVIVILSKLAFKWIFKGRR